MTPCRIFKDRLDLNSGKIFLQLPVGTKILRLSKQYGAEDSPYIWYTVPEGAPFELRTIHVVGTGHEFPAEWLDWHIGTEIFSSGAFVFHFFLEPAR